MCWPGNIAAFMMQVVRRRAVPREVGPPPGGPTLVHTQIPVVFFTQSGVPGEAGDLAATLQGPVAVCTQTMAQIGQQQQCLCCPAVDCGTHPPFHPDHIVLSSSSFCCSAVPVAKAQRLIADCNAKLTLLVWSRTVHSVCMRPQNLTNLTVHSLSPVAAAAMCCKIVKYQERPCKLQMQSSTLLV